MRLPRSTYYCLGCKSYSRISRRIFLELTAIHLMAKLSTNSAIAISLKFIADRGDGSDNLSVVSFHRRCVALAIGSGGSPGRRQSSPRTAYGSSGYEHFIGDHRLPNSRDPLSYTAGTGSGWLASQSARALIVGSTPAFLHHAASSPNRWTSR